MGLPTWSNKKSKGRVSLTKRDQAIKKSDMSKDRVKNERLEKKDDRFKNKRLEKKHNRAKTKQKTKRKNE